MAIKLATWPSLPAYTTFSLYQFRLSSFQNWYPTLKPQNHDRQNRLIRIVIGDSDKSINEVPIPINRQKIFLIFSNFWRIFSCKNTVKLINW